jgi:hypothetical protein
MRPLLSNSTAPRPSNPTFSLHRGQRFALATRAALFLALAGAADAQTSTWNAAEQAKLLPTVGVSAGDSLGQSVALSGDVAVVGAYLDHQLGSNVGAAYVFRRTGTEWNFEAQLLPQDPLTPSNPVNTNDLFGYSVGIDGDTIVVGAYGDNQPFADCGAAFVYAWNGASWQQQAILNASDAAVSDWLGYSVAIRGDTIVCGALNSDPSGLASAGAAYVFGRNDNGTPLNRLDDTWCQQAKLAPADLLANDQFGSAVAISPSGEAVAVGAWADDQLTAADAGSAYVFRRNRNGTPANPCDDTWPQESGKLLNLSFAAGDNFGAAIAVDDDLLVVGARDDDHDSISSANCGSVTTFERLAGPTWVPAFKSYAADFTANDVFGASLALDADTLVVGAYGDNGPLANNDEGSAYVFKRTPAGGWAQRLKVIASNGLTDWYFGVSVAVDGDTLLSGAVGDSTLGGAAGSAYAIVFHRETYSSFCFGDGTGPACPCSNNSVVGAQQGCKNTRGLGATLRAGGSTDSALDDLALYATNLPSGAACVLFGGPTTNAGSPFFAGLKCLPPPNVRLGLKTAPLTGYVSYGPGLNTGLWTAGQTWGFQLWYRDPTFAGCSPTQSTNLTNGVLVSF